MRINNNIMALNAHRQLAINQTNSSKSMEKLSSGFRINRAGDDAAGLSISEKMRGQIRGLKMAAKNAQDGISLIQTAEGSLQEAHAILQRMRELAVQAANDTNVVEDRQAIQNELDELLEELGRIKDTTQFNTQNLLDGTTESITLLVGANSGEIMTLNFQQKGINLTEIVGTDLNGLDVSDTDAAQDAVDSIEQAIQDVSEGRSKLGAWQNRLEHTIANLNNAAENLQAAESRIRDVDMAQEIMEYTKNNILQQAATAMLAQANMAPQSVLQLLG
ncbi:MAG: flagellin [Firmicutes bacterium]|nr:flagellin [Bacillota bacterium]